MSKKKSRRGLSRGVLIFLVIFLVGVGYVGYDTWLRPQSAGIFVITNPVAVTYGTTTVSGHLVKDAPVGSSGHYLLILGDGSSILLLTNNLDPLVGKDVTISGVLTPAPDSVSPMVMTVETVEVTQ